MATHPAMPALGLGTYRNTGHKQCRESVRTAIETGYRHIDTAEAYGNEDAVGKGIADSSIPREDIFLATKILHPKFTEDYSYDAVIESVHGCLDRLDVDRVDLLYGVHWPAGNYDAEATFQACADLYDDGVADLIGACNLTPTLLNEAQSVSDVPISTLQVEVHPLLQQRELRNYCASHDITLVAYAPLGNGAVFDDSEIQNIATIHDVSEAQVSLAWLQEKSVHSIPKATGKEHIQDNWESQELNLNSKNIETIDALDQEDRQYNPDYAPNW